MAKKVRRARLSFDHRLFLGADMAGRLGEALPVAAVV
jgi:hypothetical protein